MKCVDVYDSRSRNEVKQIPVMRRKNNSSSSSVNFFQEIHDHDDIFLIQISCWFIGEESSGLMNKGPGNGDTLGFAS